MHISRWQFLLILLVLGLLLLRESRRAPGDWFEHRFVDWLASNTVRQQSEAPCVLVGIDDSSLSEGHTWPWSALDFSLFLQGALPFKPSVIAIEPVLNWDDLNSPESKVRNQQYERILHDYLLRAPKVILGAELGQPPDSDIVPELQPVRVLRHVVGDASTIPEFADIVRNPREDLLLATTRGFTNLAAANSPVRRVPLLLRYRGEIVPSFVLQALLMFYQLTPDEVTANIGSHLDLAGRRIPIAADGTMAIYFKAPYLRIGFDDLLLAAQQTEAGTTPAVPVDRLRDSIVLLARVDHDSKTLLFPGNMHGSSGELFAAALATIQANLFVERSPIWGDAVVLAGILVLCAGFPSWDRAKVLTFGLAGLVVYLLIALGLFTLTLRWLPVTMPLGVILFALVFRLLARDRAAANEAITTS